MKYLKRIGIVIIALYLVIIFMLLSFQEQLIFRSETLPQDHVFTSSVPFEELYLKASGDAILHGLHYKLDNPNGVIIYFHGNAQTLEYWGKWAEKLSQQYNYDVVVMDYRGYGKSTGKRSHKAMLGDGLLFYDYCKTKFSEAEITIFGRSLGGAFATHVAKKSSAKLLLLESTFTSVTAIANKRFWFLPIGWLLQYPFQNDQNIAQITLPTYIIHGTNDVIIPYKHGQKLYEKSGSNTKKFYTIKDGFHNNLISHPTYFEALDEILNTKY
ncbi:2-succinyl-6-hydroxy-2,4-cyclohexadiene-1-carboxylate synthase [Kordia antarctica]|uniref:2-succinyl-6-hydroxy-2, 4-cyclohexadiene-1-carboxylate synthase n=1 Tax=Kordia antarctica TaxID=1218801 RepID=A0A7L4ZE07_9FLAO|nr:alpha/beta hydrolase [Kordia antarctica]QHI34973.1 2-succinyl-6-hydroxy-2,4-cyclohexadiene-1-carboxylate synthase [Kordia antarctica]